jgi:hypothetical protein
MSRGAVVDDRRAGAACGPTNFGGNRQSARASHGCDAADEAPAASIAQVALNHRGNQLYCINIDRHEHGSPLVVDSQASASKGSSIWS